jgi:FkbM family methyltransferase
VYQRPQCAVSTHRFGNPGGRWSLAPEGMGPQSVVYAFGIGTEISFELALIDRFGLTVHAFDPTPLALHWAAGQQLPAKFLLHPFGIADYDGLAHFAPPRKRKFASFSMVRAGGVGRAVTAPVRRLATLRDTLRLPPAHILKMDIEGAEYAVLADVLKCGFRPAQILVEFHHHWREVGPRKTRDAIDLLNRHGYQVADVSPNGMEFLFLL